MTAAGCEIEEGAAGERSHVGRPVLSRRGDTADFSGTKCRRVRQDGLDRSGSIGITERNGFPNPGTATTISAPVRTPSR